MHNIIKLESRADYEQSLALVNEEFTLAACIVAILVLFYLDASAQVVMLASLCLLGAIYTVRTKLEHRLQWWTLCIAVPKILRMPCESSGSAPGSLQRRSCPI